MTYTLTLIFVLASGVTVEDPGTYAYTSAVQCKDVGDDHRRRINRFSAHLGHRTWAAYRCTPVGE